MENYNELVERLLNDERFISSLKERLNKDVEPKPFMLDQHSVNKMLNECVQSFGELVPYIEYQNAETDVPQRIIFGVKDMKMYHVFCDIVKTSIFNDTLVTPEISMDADGNDVYQFYCEFSHPLSQIEIEDKVSKLCSYFQAYKEKCAYTDFSKEQIDNLQKSLDYFWNVSKTFKVLSAYLWTTDIAELSNVDDALHLLYDEGNKDGIYPTIDVAIKHSFPLYQARIGNVILNEFADWDETMNDMLPTKYNDFVTRTSVLTADEIVDWTNELEKLDKQLYNIFTMVQKE